MCTPMSGLGLLNKAAGGNVRPIAAISPLAAMATGGIKKKPVPSQNAGA